MVCPLPSSYYLYILICTRNTGNGLYNYESGNWSVKKIDRLRNHRITFGQITGNTKQRQCDWIIYVTSQCTCCVKHNYRRCQCQWSQMRLLVSVFILFNSRAWRAATFITSSSSRTPLMSSPSSYVFNMTTSLPLYEGIYIDSSFFDQKCLKPTLSE